MKHKNSLSTGIYLLETLTSGMYNNPLSIFREYIQNSVDSIDTCKNQNKKYVNITLDPKNKSIEIFDTGPGVSSMNAVSILNKIGSSNKTNTQFRGFRGIGRLGGIAFSEKLIFRTKASGENYETIQKWNCTELRRMISNTDTKNLTLEDVYTHIIDIEQKPTKETKKSYFSVYLENVKSYRNLIFDIQKVRQYLRQVAPVPFQTSFSYKTEIEKFLNDNVANYNTYDIRLNGKQIYKSYDETVKITKGKNDYISCIEYYPLYHNQELLAVCWIGERKSLIGSIVKGDITSGVQVRSGNILIGNSHLLDKCYKENRFNSYLVGEVHIVSNKIVANSRRDDFIDNGYKELFYEVFEKYIGLTYSKKIRFNSKKKNEIIDYSKKAINIEKNDCIDMAMQNIINDKQISKTHLVEAIRKKCGQCDCISKVLLELVN